MDDNCRLLAFDNDFKFLNELKLFLRSTLQKYSQGFSRPQKETSEEFTKKLWDFDRELIGELPRQKYIIAYVTGEREHGGNWGNLVLCNSPEAIEEWKAFHYHSRAITEISPQAYTHIRIHRGTLQEGLASDKFRVTQTIFLDYGAKCTGKFVSRKVEIWTTGESSDYLETEQ
ncbi:hypothetical protein SNE40_000684 [Patella caerulea]|uniref:Uncharacterized protein n=1 Tax=Patella caerulea TaxID=87958 RepID=A0AAN8K5N6_PATCE